MNQTNNTQKDKDAELPTSPEQLFSVLAEIGVPYKLYEHEPVYTVAESSRIETDIPGLHCRNLFLRDKKKKMFLVVAANETKIDLKKLQNVIDSDRLSFASKDRLWEHLGVMPGSVCPYAVINDKQKAVKVILDKYMMSGDIVNYHPLQNNMTIGVTPNDLIKFFDYTSHKAHIVDLSLAAP
jgi:Ala-tRNA(Pro) deacylase